MHSLYNLVVVLDAHLLLEKELNEGRVCNKAGICDTELLQNIHKVGGLHLWVLGSK
jgi:hypothetical protein